MRPEIGDYVLTFNWRQKDVLERRFGRITRRGNGKEYDFIIRNLDNDHDEIGFDELISLFHVDAAGARYWAPYGIHTDSASTRVLVANKKEMKERFPF